MRKVTWFGVPTVAMMMVSTGCAAPADPPRAAPRQATIGAGAPSHLTPGASVVDSVDVNDPVAAARRLDRGDVAPGTVYELRSRGRDRAEVMAVSGSGRRVITVLDWNGRWRLGAVVPLAAAPLVIAPAAGDDTTGDGNGSFGGDGSDASIAVWASSGAGGDPVAADDADGPRPWARRAIPDPPQPSSPIGGVCNPGNDPVTGLPRFGWPYTIETVDTTTGAVVASRRICVPLDPAVAGPPPPPAIEDPPTYGEIWRAAGVAAPNIGVNPDLEGVTGLTTRLWAGGPDTVQVDATIRGYRAVGVATRVGYWFSPGDGSSVLRRDDGGTASAPAALHDYERRGDYVLAGGSLWVATVTVTGPDLPGNTIDLGQALIVVERPYRVVEVRSRLTR